MININDIGKRSFSNCSGIVTKLEGGNITDNAGNAATLSTPKITPQMDQIQIKIMVVHQDKLRIIQAVI